MDPPPPLPPRPGPLTIRLATPDDDLAVAALYAPHVVDGIISFELAPPSAAEMRQRIVSTLRQTPWLVAESEGELSGYAYASKHRERAAYQWSLDASVYVAPAHQGRGIGRALYTSLFELVRLQGYYAVHAGISLPNAASVGLHEALGFVSVGVFRAVGHKLGGWHDVGWWQLELAPRQGVPDPPRSLPSLGVSAPDRVAEALGAGQLTSRR
jgi:L-amino acid N-acyltransferase YncA